MKIQHAFGLSLLFVALLCPGTLRAQAINWTKYDNGIPDNSNGTSTNGKIPLGLSGRGDRTNAIAPSVIKEGSNYKMWYAGHDGANYRIYYATSSNGLEWTKYDNTIPANADSGVASTNGKVPLGNAGRGDDAHADAPFVIKDGGIYKMWYTGWDTGVGYRIFYATSSNGLEWTKYDNFPPADGVDSGMASTNGKIPLGSSGKGDSKYVLYSCVLKDDVPPIYKMWYSGYDGGTTTRIYYATSSNGLEWTKYDNTIPAISDGTSTNGKIPLGSSGTGDAAGVFRPFVFKEDSTYKMWYGGYDGTNWRLYHATSFNGLEWSKYNNTIPPVSDTTNSNSRLSLGTAGKGDNIRVLHPSVVVFDNNGRRYYKMWYTGYDGTNQRIYHATQPLPAGTIFTFK